MVKVISRTPICGVLYLQNIIKCKGQFAYITYSHRQFLENNHALLLSRGKSQYNPPGIQGTYETASPAQGSYKPLTNFSVSRIATHLLDPDSMPPLLRTAKSCCHDGELSIKEHWCSKMHHSGTTLHESNIPGSGYGATYLMNCIEEAPVKVC